MNGRSWTNISKVKWRDPRLITRMIRILWSCSRYEGIVLFHIDQWVTRIKEFDYIDQWDTSILSINFKLFPQKFKTEELGPMFSNSTTASFVMKLYKASGSWLYKGGPSLNKYIRSDYNSVQTQYKTYQPTTTYNYKLGDIRWYLRRSSLFWLDPLVSG